ncbi:MAG: FeoA domain-containing protein [Bdellovibrionales bacterium]|nr:FeoA domain-containing protein [Bdellovibrionales bacterium]
MAAQKAVISARDLKPGESGVIRSLAGTPGLCDRLRGLGFFPGEKLFLEMKTALGDPIIFQVRATKVALRKDEAAGILLETSK